MLREVRRGIKLVIMVCSIGTWWALHEVDEEKGKEDVGFPQMTSLYKP